MKTLEIVNANNKATEQNLISKIKQLPIISKHFENEYKLVQDENFNLPIVQISKQQKSQIIKLIE